jgi:hypothetical protein
VLWFEADLYDQLHIVQILARLAALGVPAERITVICIGEHPGIAHGGGGLRLRGCCETCWVIGVAALVAALAW